MANNFEPDHISVHLNSILEDFNKQIDRLLQKYKEEVDNMRTCLNSNNCSLLDKNNHVLAKVWVDYNVDNTVTVCFKDFGKSDKRSCNTCLHNWYDYQGSPPECDFCIDFNHWEKCNN